MCNSRYGDFENSFIAIIHARALVYQIGRKLIYIMIKINIKHRYKSNFEVELG